MTALNRKLLRDLVHLRGQMLAVVAVVMCGVAAYVTMVSVFYSLRATRASYYDRYRFADLFATVKRAPEDALEKLGNIPGVARAESRIVMDVTLDVPGLNEPATGRLVSIPERRAAMLNDLYIRTGGYVEPGRSDQAIASEAFAAANHLRVGDSLGAVINGTWRRLRIVGIALSPEYVYEFRGNGALFPDNRRFGVLWMSRPAMSAAFDMEGAFNDVAIRLRPGTREQDVIDRMNRALERYGSFGAYGRSEQISARFLADELSQLKANALVIPVIFLGVAAFLLHIVLSRLVGTQRDQVAVLKAFGYGNRAVGLHYLKFALAAVLVGAGVGTLLGMWMGAGLTELYTQFYRFPILRYEASPAVIVYAVLIGVGAAVLGALSAVRRAVSLPPAEAMRPETPPRFKPGPLESLGLARLLSASTRMVLRNLERNPGKAFVTSLGIALSVAILVTGYCSYDAVNFMNDMQFRTVQREDVSVMFNAPRPPRAMYDLAHLPGVVRAEPFRAVAARVRFEHHERQLAVMGLQPNAELRRIVDQSYHVIGVPAEGVVLTKKLAEMFGLKSGDTLTVEVLEGARPVRRLVVNGLVDELLGLSVYMEIGSLNRMMGEGSTISGAFVAIDPLREQELYERLKHTPAVAGVVVRKATLESFEKTIAESQGISRSALILFASVIAIGIVYNSARIALSERGRELASLRVLGFTRREVAAMLLGEQAVLTVLAIPLGSALGYVFAWLVMLSVENDLYRFPLVISGTTYASAAVTVVIASLLSALLVRRRLYRLDLIEVLKTRE